MKDFYTVIFVDYYKSLINDVPQYIYEILFAVLCIATILILLCKGFEKGWRIVARTVLVGYIFLAYCSTLIFRSINPDIIHKLKPFWSYSAILSDPCSTILPEIVMNIAAFIPMGLLFGMAFRSARWWMVLLAGGAISVSIEVLQYIMARGVSEFDDVMHNVLGSMIGYGLYCAAVNCRRHKEMNKQI